MGKKLLLAAVTTFLLMAVIFAFYSDGSLAGAHPYYLGDVGIYSVVTYPLAAAIVIWVSHHFHSPVADRASSQHVVRTQNVSGSLFKNDRYIVLLYFVIKSDISSWPYLNPNMGVGSSLEFEGEKPCALASQYSS
jgi:hypothetical protein